VKNIYVTKPFLPPLEEYTALLKEIWESKTLTNNGPFNKKFELKLARYLGVEHVSLVNNATTGLMIALKALQINRDVITTPFSFIATSHVVKWNGLNPIFVDTDNSTGNLLVDEIEKKICGKTGGILATHNFGLPGCLTKMDNLSKKYNLSLIYDAAPAIGVKINGESVLKFGDISVISFHATKVLNTFEGGAIITKSKKIKKKVDLIKNFGIKNEEKVTSLGINGKMSEINSAMGLLQLKYLDKIINERKKIYDIYRDRLKKSKNIQIMEIPRNIDYNYAYFFLLFNEGKNKRDKIYEALKIKKINCRKYWYPLITEHPMYINANLKNAKHLSEKILALPIYPFLEAYTQNVIIETINGSLS
tara:strand:+ start:1633 stop:2721 length:1089 start_codon:yes stop_codon:yes gene_type:complete